MNSDVIASNMNLKRDEDELTAMNRKKLQIQLQDRHRKSNKLSHHLAYSFLQLIAIIRTP